MVQFKEKSKSVVVAKLNSLLFSKIFKPEVIKAEFEKIWKLYARLYSIGVSPIYTTYDAKMACKWVKFCKQWAATTLSSGVMIEGNLRCFCKCRSKCHISLWDSKFKKVPKVNKIKY